jgi:hypothetical protein
MDRRMARAARARHEAARGCADVADEVTLPEVEMSLDVYRDESAGDVGRATSESGEAELLTVKEAAEFLRVTVSWIYEHV